MRVLGILFAVLLAIGAQAQSLKNPCPDAQPVPQQLKLPAFIPPGEPVEVEKRLLKYSIRSSIAIWAGAGISQCAIRGH
jgi:hypothetical protein